MINEALIVLSAVFLILIFTILFYARFINFKKHIEAKWIDLYETLRKKQDMAPCLIEVARRYIDTKELIKQVVSARKNAYFNPSDVNMAELDFAVKRLIGLEKKNRKLKYDLDFLDIKNCFDENDGKMRRLAVEYNIAVSKYNKFATVFGENAPLFKI